MSATWVIRFGTYTKGASRIFSPLPAENVKDAILAVRFSPTASFASVAVSFHFQVKHGNFQQPKVRYYCYLVYILIVVHVFVIPP